MNKATDLKTYTKTGCGTDCEGGYEIALAGVEAAETPEPPLAAITGIVLVGLGAFGMKRRKKFTVESGRRNRLPRQLICTLMGRPASKILICGKTGCVEASPSLNC